MRSRDALEVAADLLAGEVCKLVDAGKLNARSPAADALLDYAENRWIRVSAIATNEAPLEFRNDPIGAVRWRLAEIRQEREAARVGRPPE